AAVGGSALAHMGCDTTYAAVFGTASDGSDGAIVPLQGTAVSGQIQEVISVTVLNPLGHIASGVVQTEVIGRVRAYGRGFTGKEPRIFAIATATAVGQAAGAAAVFSPPESTLGPGPGGILP